ncbi:MAG: AAA family ATPase [Rhodospirillaceae bacterium]|mgnify:CR=1 FL=1|jgi:predicted ATPase with chaperone activity|nr:AAA family ATPase [Rhodospirillaceae bacterium]MBT7770444.1 AAA family ATPase [Rhodospirillales bacterium]MBT4701882.1 AAA family ATPase [Rhodospirillaceae bacterium]MBT5033128.1 AAA family ATPase [Rhodospirillaceae bacterium]MBT6219936.1 AAA family ATPase [Rhodospirillaceae bacterium]
MEQAPQNTAPKNAVEAPPRPADINATGLDLAFIINLIAKGMYLENLEEASQITQAIKLSTNIVNGVTQEMLDRKLIHAAGSTGVGALSSIRYQLTREGQQVALDACNQNQYFGPAPVTLEDFQARVLAQKIAGEWVSKENIAEAFADIIVPENFVKRLGPAINSGHSILIYGPAGNGKTTVAEKVAAIFESVVYIPHCIEIEGNIIKVFDPAVHKAVGQAEKVESSRPSLRRERSDQRWVACQRPVVVTGGELTMEMLDLKFNEFAKFYEAPLHMKALNGTFIIDDFGRQRVSPEEILNRWIVPLQTRIDNLTLHSGKAFTIPFDELLIFSTNLAPEDLMDPAFLRRIPYKLETYEPSKDAFRQIFTAVAAKQGLQLTDEIFDYVVRELQETVKKPLACYQPKFIVDQVIAACKYEGIAPIITEAFVADAMSNLYVHDSSYVGQVGTGDQNSD